MKRKLVESKAIASANLYRELPNSQKPYNWPYIFIYPMWLYIYFVEYQRVLGSFEYTFLSLVFVVGSHILLRLMCEWDVNVRARLMCSEVETVQEADLVKIITAEHQGKNAMVQIDRTFNKRGDLLISFKFQEIKYIYEDDKKLFKTIEYPCDMGYPVEHFRSAKGLSSEKQLEEEQYAYGDNRFHIPIPTFVELFKEHAVAPFFVFQVFCVGLWCLDSYWYYSVFTLFMLIVFESTLVFQRVRTLGEFRTLAMKPYKINVYRMGKWKEVETTELLPGDVVSIVRSEGENAVPCDVVLVGGNCIVNEAMLSGESTPQLKERVSETRAQEAIGFDIEGRDKGSVLFGGTKVLQVDLEHKTKGTIMTPDGGCTCVVLRTGFGTAQGELVRTMIFSTEQVTANNKESYIFILFLLCFAFLAAGYVWHQGMKDARRTTTKVLLDCILIITSVVPPELPMELSMAVNSSLMALSKYAIYCTEPFRIPFAGRLDVLCFDKTGTLTGEQLVVDGVAGVVEPINGEKGMQADGLIKVNLLGPEGMMTIATAHALARLDDGTLVGDPMEQAQLQSTRFEMAQDGTMWLQKSSSRDLWMEGIKLIPKRRFPFLSELKRNAVVSWASSSPNGKAKHFVSVKGAPEALRGMFVNIPAWYDETFKHYSRRGGRVLALGSKWIDREHIGHEELGKWTRESVESELEFQGFLVFSCPLKPDSASAIKMLNDSQHRCIMITGDNALTAVHVAGQVRIVEKPVLIFDADSNNKLVCTNVEEDIHIGVLPDEPLDSEILADWELCMTGPALDLLRGSVLWRESLLHNVWVYARVSPAHKEFILTELKSSGYCTLMCGDGTNDVGALKQAHIGVALLNGTTEDLEKIQKRNQIERVKAGYDAQVKLSKRFGQPPPPPPSILKKHMDELLSKSQDQNQNQQQIQQQQQPQQQQPQQPQQQQTRQQQAEQLQQELGTRVNDWLATMESMEEDVPTIKFGDASVASPFTSKLGSIHAVCNIVRQGRCTLVATIQMYKILALNCLISAYSMSVMYLAGIKYGDYQATIMGILMSVCFMCISKASPLEKLSRERPQPNILNFYVLLTVLGQFFVHIFALVFVTMKVNASQAQDSDLTPIDLDSPFEPNLLNTAMYLLSLSQQISTFAINYQGHPFRESIRENTYLFRGLASVGMLVIVCATEMFPSLNVMLKLVDMPEIFRNQLVFTILLDFAGAYLIERVCRHFFSDCQPKPISARDCD